MTIWQRIKAWFQRKQAVEASTPVVEEPKKELQEDDPTPWMTLAHREIGQKEVPGEGDNPRILEYHASTTLKATEDSVPWCSSFVTWCLENSHYQSSRDAWARSYLQVGQKLAKGKYGCIVVLSRGADSGHVGFYLDETETMVYILGGNQSDAVTRQWFSKERVLGYRWPIKKA